MSNEKWSCPHCTFINFPASKKCTMCNISYSKPDDDIKGMCSSSEISRYIIPKSLPLTPQVSSRSSKINWKCKPCGSKNIEENTSCFNCNSIRNNVKISEMNQENSKCNLDSITYCEQSAIEDNKPDVQVEAQDNENKWVCANCTYLNYKASSVCTMCKSPCISNMLITNLANTLSETSLTSQNNKTIPKSLSYNHIFNQKVLDDAAVSNKKYKDKLIKDKDLGISTINQQIAAGSLNVQNKKALTVYPSKEMAKNKTSESSKLLSPMSNAKTFQQSMSESRLLYKKRKRSQINRLFLKACKGIVEDNYEAVSNYIVNRGNISRPITADEAVLLNRPSVFSAGFTLVHLALRFNRKNILTLLLNPEVSSLAYKKNPSIMSPDMAEQIQKEISASLRIELSRKDCLLFKCQYFSQFNTFQLPLEISDLPTSVSERLFKEVIDEHAQKELEEASAINWLPGIIQQVRHLYALWNRSAGDCLLDSVLQATWGVFDQDNSLRTAMSESLRECNKTFYCRWREWELNEARSMGFTMNERQCFQQWTKIHQLAQQPGASLEHCHIFVLCHILRRPIIVYGIKYLRNYTGDAIGFAKFQGVYLPFFWDRDECFKSPIALGYTRGHFSALVSMNYNDNEIVITENQSSSLNSERSQTYLPLQDFEGNNLAVHFKSSEQATISEEQLLHDWLECSYLPINQSSAISSNEDHCETAAETLLVCKQTMGKRPPSVARMLDDWLDHYRYFSFQKTSFEVSDTSSEAEEENDE